MKVHIIFFGDAQRVLGKKEIDFEFTGNTISDLKEALCKISKAISPVIENSMFAVNMEYKNTSETLSEGDIVAVIPPVGGG